MLVTVPMERKRKKPAVQATRIKWRCQSPRIDLTNAQAHPNHASKPSGHPRPYTTRFSSENNTGVLLAHCWAGGKSLLALTKLVSSARLSSQAGFNDILKGLKA